jgi:hypothetical protein
MLPHKREWLGTGKSLLSGHSFLLVDNNNILTINTHLTLTNHCKDQVKIHKLKNSYFNHVWWHLTILASTGVAMVMLVICDLTSSQQ